MALLGAGSASCWGLVVVGQGPVPGCSRVWAVGVPAEPGQHRASGPLHGDGMGKITLSVWPEHAPSQRTELHCWDKEM